MKELWGMFESIGERKYRLKKRITSLSVPCSGVFKNILIANVSAYVIQGLIGNLVYNELYLIQLPEMRTPNI